MKRKEPENSEEQNNRTKTSRMTAVNGYVCKEKDAPLEPFSYELPADLSPTEVEVNVSHCGVCYSDLHMIKDNWFMSEFPFIPGHEIIGEVTAVGSSVKDLKPGQRVGIGWQCGSCFNCDSCKNHHEQFCKKSEVTIGGRNGGFADKIRVDARFSYPIPASLKSEETAPLLCAGLTVFSALKHFGVKSGQSVGIIGLGGLGHIAVQMAAAMGCEVTVFSGSAQKEADAKSFGAKKFVNTTDKAAMRAVTDTLDFIFATAKADPKHYLWPLKTDGTLVLLDTNDPIELPLGLLQSRKKISSSLVGSREDAVEMLQFAAKHNIRPKVELMELSKVNEALKKLENNEARYRIVLSTKHAKL